VTHDRDLRELAAPLLADPPHPRPPLDELERRVGRRRQRRARAIGVCSVLAVVLVATAVLALPRDSELQVGDGATPSPTTAPPPPFVPGPVQLAVTPESAPLDAERTIEIRNGGAGPYFSCLGFNLFRWTGADWEPVAQLHLGASARSGEEATLSKYEARPPVVDCNVTTVAAGGTTTFAFDAGLVSWHPEDGTTPPRTDALADGWYEVREYAALVDEPTPGLGRFEITRPGTESGPPGMEAGRVQLVVAPQSAPLAADRSIEIRNTGEVPYASCLAYNLFRWSGSDWEPAAQLHLQGPSRPDLPPTLREYTSNPPALDCTATTIAAGESTSFPFRIGAAPVFSIDGTTLPGRAPLADGWYEIREFALATAEPTAGLGRFEIGPGVAAPTESPPSPEDDLPVSIDLYPEALAPGGEVLPTTVFVVDQDTIALAWTGPCNQPADRVTFDAHDGEIELRLHVGFFVVIDCTGEPDDWIVTFDVPFTITDRVRLVARAEGADGEVDRVPGPVLGALGGGDTARLPDGSPVSFRATELADPERPGRRTVSLALPYPLDGAFACDVSTSVANDIYIPMVQVQDTTTAPGLTPCSRVQTLQELFQWRILGQP
jgi:hypothetical protein